MAALPASSTRRLHSWQRSSFHPRLRWRTAWTASLTLCRTNLHFPARRQNRQEFRWSRCSSGCYWWRAAQSFGPSWRPRRSRRPPHRQTLPSDDRRERGVGGKILLRSENNLSFKWLVLLKLFLYWYDLFMQLSPALELGKLPILALIRTIG